jgi:beta-mannosidase
VTYIETGDGPPARRPLHEGWALRLVGGPDVPETFISAAPATIPARVPGCVHTDLLAAGLIPDPFVDDNEVRLSWIGRADWSYETTFDWADGAAERVDLVCDGLDTVARIDLNGVELGRTQNMHRGYRFDTAPGLRVGPNVVRVEFGSAYAYAQSWAERLGRRPGAYDQPFNFIRKMACNFGWDWGPTLVTAGIWRPIGLHAWSVARLASVRPLVTTAGADGRVEVHVEFERTASEPLVLTVAVGEAAVRVPVDSDASTAVAALTVPDVRRWWPRGLGDQVRYPLTVDLSGQDGRPLDRWRRSVGFRDVRLDTTPDRDGTPYTLIVNDVPVFVRGVNWIPDDTFPTRISRERLETRLRQAAAANVNFLRIWGGGRYESEDFYDLADSLGLMVGQDFLFACAAYPEESPFAEEVEAEARDQVVRLAPHPSLVWWTGNNENIWGHEDWNWKEPLAGRTWGAGYYFDLLPRVVAELDPTRPYWPGSPYSGRDDVHPNDPAHGTMHIWDVWNTDDYTRYREYAPRFVAEFGYQAPATYATMRRALADSPLAADSPGMRHHQKAVDGAGKLARGLAAHLPEPRDFDDWHYLTQVNQARAIQLGVEHFRSLRPLCMGAIVWQLNDCWPVTSWAAIDSDGREKPLWFALRRVFADRLVAVVPRDAHDGDGGLSLVAVNDGPTPWEARFEVARLDLDGERHAATTIEVRVAPRSSQAAALPKDVCVPDDPRAEVLVADADGTRAWWFFAEDRDIAYPAPRYDARVEPVDGGQRVTVTARTVLRDLTLYPDRLDPRARVDQALVTLLPGETARFTVTAPEPLDPEALTTRPVLRCVNDLPVPSKE